MQPNGLWSAVEVGVLSKTVTLARMSSSKVLLRCAVCVLRLSTNWGDVLGQEVDAGAQELSEEEPCAWEAGRRHRCEEEPAQQGLVTALVVILVVFLVVILVFFLVQTGFLKRKRGGKKMTGVDDLVRTSSA